MECANCEKIQTELNTIKEKCRALALAIRLNGSIDPGMLRQSTKIAGGLFNLPQVRTWFDAMADFVEFVETLKEDTV